MISEIHFLFFYILIFQGKGKYHEKSRHEDTDVRGHRCHKQSERGTAK